MESLQGKVIFIHDAANALSEKIALTLLQAGASVILSSQKCLKLPTLMEHARDLNFQDRLHVLSFSLKSNQDHELAEKAVLRGFGGLDVFISLPENLEACHNLSETKDQDWENAMHLQLKTHFSLARSFMPLLALRPSSLYINVSPSSVMQGTPGHGMEGISHSVRFLMAQTLSFETEGNPSIHNLVLSPSIDASDSWITATNIDSAICTLIRNATWNRGYLEFNSNWRDRMEESTERYVGGI